MVTNHTPMFSGQGHPRRASCAVSRISTALDARYAVIASAFLLFTSGLLTLSLNSSEFQNCNPFGPRCHQGFVVWGTKHVKLSPAIKAAEGNGQTVLHRRSE